MNQSPPLAAASVLALDLGREGVFGLLHTPGSNQPCEHVLRVPSPDDITAGLLARLAGGATESETGAGLPADLLVSTAENRNSPDDDSRTGTGALEALLSHLAQAACAESQAQAGEFAQSPLPFVAPSAARGIPAPGLLSFQPHSGLLPRLSLLPGAGCFVTDAALASMLALLSLSGVSERSWREGITLLRMGRQRVSAALFFQEHMLSFVDLNRDLALPSGASADLESFAGMLADFRLGWLPQEKARSLGGFVWRASELPAEAEGFMPVYAGGPDVGLMAGRARLMPPAASGSPEARCRGLLHVYACRGFALND